MLCHRGMPMYFDTGARWYCTRQGSRGKGRGCSLLSPGNLPDKKVSITMLIDNKFPRAICLRDIEGGQWSFVSCLKSLRLGIMPAKAFCSSRQVANRWVPV